MGKGIVEIETPQGAASGAATAATILASAHLGFGLSTTHVCTGGILGSGVGRKGAEVRWSVARKMVFAWLLTLPGAGAGRRPRRACWPTAGPSASSSCWRCSAAACLVIWTVSRKHSVTHTNVTDSREVVVLASVAPATYPDDPRLTPLEKPRPRDKAKGAA